MKFDRKAPGGGVEVYCELQMGKAILEWKFYCLDAEQEACVKLFVTDRNGNPILEARQSVQEEEPLKTILLHPRLWNSTEDPYLYQARAVLLKQGEQMQDTLTFSFPVRSFGQVPGKGFLLNGEPFLMKAVELGEAESEEAVQKMPEVFLKAGANTVCISRPCRLPSDFIRRCEELGFVVWINREEKQPRAVDGTLFWKNGSLTDLFYQYKAKWSEDPFVYISAESLKRQENGNFTVTVYSNQKKTALYADGILFEFQTGEEEFTFREIPFPGLFLCLGAEAGECRASLSLHRSFTKNN